ncbi:MAG: alpha-ketoglutarate-dependent dioxygenase AlkB [Alphaproteobacteria bacterium]|nr:alpha-ketoglutarate-dependent dioxygenase AlkB [Alphaproteobacteria bacterium]
MMIDGFRHLDGYLDAERQRAYVQLVRGVLAKAPLYRPQMPRSGKPFSILMTNCGGLGWVSDKDGGYRYQPHHPATGRPWPAMPRAFLELWADVAGWPAPPEACLINFYAAGTRLGSHVDCDEAEMRAPVVSVSLGDDAIFHVGGSKRADRKSRMTLRSGDVVVLGGASRRAYHGIDRVIGGTSNLLADGGRINLTLRRVTTA